jgi:fatty acid desaturase
VTTTIRTGGLTPAPEHLPDVLPSDRLTRRGRLVPEVRREVKDIPDLANALRVLWIWGQAVLVLGVAAWLAHPVVWVVAGILMSRVIVLCNILTHEAVHRLLFSNRRVNDTVGRWLLSYPALVPYDAYRRAHVAHHRDAFGPEEPDLLLYGNYPTTAASFRRKLRRDLLFVSGLKLLRGLVSALGSPNGRPVALRIFAVQAALFVAFGLVAAWWAYPLLWLLPWLTIWRVIARLRAVAEHGGLERSEDEREVCHHVRQRPLQKLWLAPYNTGYHLAHHIDPALPFGALPTLHRELESSGYVEAELVYDRYTDLWRTLAGAEEPATP